MKEKEQLEADLKVMAAGVAKHYKLDPDYVFMGMFTCLLMRINPVYFTSIYIEKAEGIPRIPYIDIVLGKLEAMNDRAVRPDGSNAVH